MLDQLEVAPKSPVDILDCQFKAAYIASMNALTSCWRPRRGVFVFGDGKAHTRLEIAENFKMKFDGETDPQTADKMRVFNHLIEDFIKSL